uniref:PML-RARA regulated adaptor molecule 1 n=1 Tax=Xenopus tropicalis TaxID=8364 RepID=A0A6I8RMS0_XENTR
MNLKRTEKLEKEFRKKFQFHGEIKILTRMMVDPNAVLGKLGDKDLLYTKGEILDVIQLTNTDKILCRNCEGKCKYQVTNDVTLLLFKHQITHDMDSLPCIPECILSGGSVVVY